MLYLLDEMGRELLLFSPLEIKANLPADILMQVTPI